MAHSRTESLHCFLGFVVLGFFDFTLTSINLHMNGCIFPFPSVYTATWLFFSIPLPLGCTFSLCSSVFGSLGANITGLQNWHLFVVPFRSFVFKNERFKCVLFVLDVKESELFIGHVYVGSLMCRAFLTNLWCSNYFSHFIDKDNWRSQVKFSPEAA